MDKANIKLIALDLDDTTLKSDGTLANETKYAIERAVDFGIEVVVASGRAFSALPEQVIKISGIRYAVTSNGSAVNWVPNGNRIVSHKLLKYAIDKILKIVEPFRNILATEVFIDGVPYTSHEHVNDPQKYGCSPAYVEYLRNTRTPVDNIVEFTKENIENFDSMVIACADTQTREFVRNEIYDNVGGIKLTSSVRHLIEIIHENAGKDSGVRFICEMLGISCEQIVAFGNADNDIDMMKYAGVGVAVSNASKNCLAAADIIIGNNNEHSVAKFINDICDGKVLPLTSTTYNK